MHLLTNKFVIGSIAILAISYFAIIPDSKVSPVESTSTSSASSQGSNDLHFLNETTLINSPENESKNDDWLTRLAEGLYNTKNELSDTKLQEKFDSCKELNKNDTYNSVSKELNCLETLLMENKENVELDSVISNEVEILDNQVNRIWMDYQNFIIESEQEKKLNEWLKD